MKIIRLAVYQDTYDILNKTKEENSKICMELQNPSNRSHLAQKEQSRSHTDIEIYYKTVEIEKAWYWHENKPVEQKEGLEINLCIYSHVIFQQSC